MVAVAHGVDLAEAEHRQYIADLEASGWIERESWARDDLAEALLGVGKYLEAHQVLQPNILALPRGVALDLWQAATDLLAEYSWPAE